MRNAVFLTIILAVGLIQSACAAPSSANRLDAEPGVRVTTGLDVLEAEGFARLKGRKVGVIVNHSAINAKGVHAIDLFDAADGIEIVTLFSPEHGIRGTEDRHVDNDKDEKTGLTIHSLYGKTRRPNDESYKVWDPNYIAALVKGRDPRIGACADTGH